MTKTTNLAALLAAGAALSACGGGGSAPAPAPPPAPPAPQGFTYVAPAVGETDVWSRVLTDSVGNSVTMQVRQQVSSTDASGNLTVTYDDPTGVDVVEDGLAFRTAPQVSHVSPTGATLDYTTTAVDGTQTTCVYGSVAPAAAQAAVRARALALARVQTIYVGQTYISDYAITCGAQAPVAFHVTATVVGLESVTVPAGTFQALKEVVSTTWTAAGFANSNDAVVWRDPGRSLFTLRLDETYVRGDTSRPSMAHETRELLSRP